MVWAALVVSVVKIARTLSPPGSRTKTVRPWVLPNAPYQIASHRAISTAHRRVGACSPKLDPVEEHPQLGHIVVRGGVVGSQHAVLAADGPHDAGKADPSGRRRSGLSQPEPK